MQTRRGNNILDFAFYNVTFSRSRRALRSGGMMKIRFPKSETYDKLCRLNIESRCRRPCGRETRLRISGLP